MLTGCRLGEIAALEWDWIKGRRIHLPDSKSGPRTVWLSSAARAVIDAIPRYSEDCPYIFPSRPPTRPIDNFGTQWDRIRNEAGLPGLRIHDLRHSWASTAAMNGVDMVTVAKLLGHALVETTERYVHLSDQSVSDAADRVSGRIHAALAGRLRCPTLGARPPERPCVERVGARVTAALDRWAVGRARNASTGEITQVGSHTQSFKRALRAALREDPDILLIGEMRDLETVSIAIETAETGHLVFGTLHTTTAVSTVDRIIDQFPADRQAQIRVMLSESLKGVIAQVLLKKTGGGRVPAREILLSIGAVSNLIREGKTHQLPSTLQTNKKIGMSTLNDSLMELVDKRVVDPAEAYMKAVDKAGFESMLKAKHIALKLPD